LKKWSEVWVNQSSRPVLSESIIYQNNKITSFTLSQKAEDGSDKLWPQTFEVALVYPDSTYTLEVSIADKKTELNGAKGLPVPQAIIYNSNAFGYGVFPMQPNDVKIIPGLKDEVARGYAYLNMYENVLTGNLEVKKIMPVVLQGIQSETNELIHGLLCGQASGLFWGFLSPEEREDVQPDMEQVLWKQLTVGKHSSNFKKNIFNLWKGMAYSKKGMERLYRVWNKDMTISDLRLNQDDFTNMAMGLALFGHEASDVILETAKEALTNQDKIKRFEFLKPALSSDVLVRNQFFESFRDAKNREKESWVLTACGYMHHPLRQQESVTMVPLALDLLEDIQKTGDIFFPKRWLSTTVGQYQSEEALQMVELYLESRPNLNPSLKGKLLQATDDLYRYQKLLGN
jgi:aminopeptidase N